MKKKYTLIQIIHGILNRMFHYDVLVNVPEVSKKDYDEKEKNKRENMDFVQN